MNDATCSKLPRQWDIELAYEMFPRIKRDNIIQNHPFVIDGLAEFHLMHKPHMVLMALATIRAETSSFRPISEGKSKYNTVEGGVPFARYDFRHDLGNCHTGDGARYKGRGFVQLTGHDNYLRVGNAIGVDLIAEPELANDPAVAGRILAQFLSAREDRIMSALKRGDLAKARRVVNGGTHGLDRFEDAYRRGEKYLNLGQ